MKKVLIAEDNPLNMKLFRDILEFHKFHVICVEDAFAIIDAIKSHKPHLVLMDIRFPEISGVDIIKQIKSDVILAKIPIIALTAFAMKHDRERILASGCEAYLSKPISIDQLVAEVRKHTSKITHEIS